MYQLTSDQLENGRRVKTFTNKNTGTESKTTPIYTDSNGVEWWGFIDLFKIPYIRTAYAKHISDTFTMGLSLKDILQWCNNEKELLKSNDPEKYEKLYALILEKERLANYTADPIKQHLSLCTVYILQEDERIDYFSDTVADEKLKMWGADLRATAFFLSWHNDSTVNFMKDCNEILPIVLESQNRNK